MDPKNKDGLEITQLTSSTSDDAEWVGASSPSAAMEPRARR